MEYIVYGTIVAIFGWMLVPLLIQAYAYYTWKRDDY